jgi:hypothetical protein
VAAKPVAIQCLGRKWAVVRFAEPLEVAEGCGVVEDGCVCYLIGVSHARLWFVAGGQAIEVVRRGFTARGIEMNILPWEAPADALRRHTGFSV